jgi:uncharacterized protein YndB with AHSA1/START domain
MTDLGPNDLELTRHLKAPRAAVWRCWTEPALLMQWFCPRPWSVSECRSDLRPGGLFGTEMRGPNGEVHESDGAWLEVVPMARLTFTNVLTAGWRPTVIRAGEPRMTATITFRDLSGGGTLYTARVQHPTKADSDIHAAIGFDAGWGAAAAQLDELALTL